MKATELMEELQTLGVQLEARGDRLRFRPPGVLTPELRNALAEKKLEVIALLLTGDSEVAWRAAVMVSQIPLTGYVPLLVARKALESKAGHCLSCGEILKGAKSCICTICGRAKNIAIEIAMTRPVSADLIA
jgi:hypothetical protein